MAFKVDVREDGTPVRWTLDRDGGATPTADPDYRPSVYAAARDDRTEPLEWLGRTLADDPKVASVEEVWKHRSLRADGPSPMREITLERLDEVRQVAREIRQREHETLLPGALSLYDVDLDPQFRYVLDRGLDPSPERTLETLDLSLPAPAVADGDLGPLRIDGVSASEASGVSGERSESDAPQAGGSDGSSSRAKRSGGEPAAPDDGPAAADSAVVSAVEGVLAARDPDVLLLSSAEIVPLLADAGVDLGRRSGFRRIAGENAYVSYGQVGHSSARYDVPGRVLIDRSSSFLLGHSNLAGLLCFVERAGKPLQELAKDSIGGVLTAIEIRKAREWTEAGVPAPWQKRQTEGWKSIETLHAADRGGFTFQPEPGVHEDVHELDFASLYPNVIREYRVSPDTVCCDCHDAVDVPERQVPELGYSICPDGDAFLGEVLKPLIDDRKRWKGEIRAAAPDDDVADREAKVDAIKWVLVSCFGYQGYRHTKFGRIEVHEAINAWAREIVLTAKCILEDTGWRIVHGIVDSLWVTAAPDREQEPIREVAEAVTADVDIELEYEGRFDWIAFCPRKRASGAALMRYFGRWGDDAIGADAAADRYKLRGIEVRQRSTCAFVADAQRDLLSTFDRERAPEPVCDRLERHLRRLRGGEVDPADLAITQRVSKAAEDYEQATRVKAALQRAADVGVPRSPGQSLEYVVVDDGLAGPERVRLGFEVAGGDGFDARAGGGEGYDAEFYADRLLRACESLIVPLGWDEGRIRSHLQSDRNAALSAYGE